MKNSHILVILLFIGGLFSCKPAYQNAKDKYKLGEYQTAIPLFESALKKGKHAKEQGEINFYIAESYRLSNRIEEAIPYYEKALDGKYYNDKLAFYYGMALKSAGKYDEAKKQFSGFIKIGGDGFLVKRARSELQNMSDIKDLSEPKKYIRLENLAGINSESADYAPVIWGENLVFTSTRKKEKTYEATGDGFADLYYIPLDKIKEADLTPEAFSATINADGFHDATPAFTNKGETMIFARSNSGEKKEEVIFDVNLYQTEGSEEEGWSEPKVVVDLVKNNKWDGTPAFSADGKTLYFASDRDGGYGGLDIYYATQNGRGEWSRPKNLGKSINTAGNDMFPHVTKDGVLYFSSDGHPGLGGLDIFQAVRVDGEITIENMGAPVNSSADDFGMIITGEKEGIFTSNRMDENAKGDDDIYWFIDETPEIRIINYFLAGISYEEDSAQNRTILPNTNIVLTDKSGQVVEKVTSDENGKFEFEAQIEVDTEYELLAEESEDHYKKLITYSTVGKGIDPEGLEEDTTNITLNTEIAQERKPEEIIILEETGETEVQILYDLGKFDIRPDAAVILDDFVKYLQEHPEVNVELGSHTDSRGGARFNQQLSEKRAKAAVDYIVSKGIDQERLTAKGYGKSDLKIANAKNEEEHQQNRRTTIKTVK